jgi:hypothetical protein
LLNSAQSGRIDPARDFVLVGKERHVPAQESPDMGGYPSRAIRTHDFLYVRNFSPARWPNGTPYYESAAIPGNWYADTDNGPTKSYMIENRHRDAQHHRLYEAAFGMRPAEELYDLTRDPHQLTNVAGDPAYAAVQRQLASRLEAQLKSTADPRLVGGAELFDQSPYLGAGPKHPAWEAARRE